MSIDCSHLQRIVHSVSLVEECDLVPSGALRLSTPFLYPNGSHVDVFLEQKDLLFEAYTLSDYGHTGLYLHDAQVKMDSTERRRQILNDICTELGVSLKGGSFEVELSAEDLADISGAIMRLSQACIRVSDFASHQRLRSENAFRDDLEEFLEAAGFEYKADVKVRGPYGRDVKIDFQIRNSYILVLAAMNETAAHSSANEIFAKWHDLGISGAAPDAHSFVTVYNSASPAIRPDDIQRLSEDSETISYPEQSEMLTDVLNRSVGP